ncbi:RNA polymerase recycling motor HelD [Bacillus suaedae]|uniref:AAA family ATPase n=1 Tax=Halalkalibacter suaedae TaxID=2822140 RepID=A0A940WUB0_9BACI|nr:RNA polymerase recycling motor HelD [Bacillus suaedae]MBP3950373.1 AAA family ATPase [Bacillus suaedae]
MNENEKAKELNEEQHRVDEVIEYIGHQIEELETKVGKRKTDAFQIRKNFWEDVTVNLDNAEEASETFASIKQQAELLSERERSQQHDLKLLRKFDRLKQSPYFGRVDFQEEGEQQSEQVYVGIGSVSDKEGFDFYVYDWRAPISSLYYDYGPGPASYDTPEGLIEGEVLLKKQLLIKRGKVEHVFDTGVTIGDEVLQEVLGSQADAQMKSIVSTIQKEQNQIIRNERGKLLIVQGVAGSGKTSVALQRIAYLLYRNRETLQADQVLLFSPNPLFNKYVASVLPELGEENMQQTTFQAYIQYRLSSQFVLEDPFDQLEYVITQKEDPGYYQRIESIRMKSTLSFMKEIDRYLLKLENGGMIFKDIFFRGEVIFTSSWIKETFYQLDSSLSIPNRLEMVSETLMRHVKIIEKEERLKEWVEDEVELLDHEVLQKVYTKLENESNDENGYYDTEREQHLLRSLVVKKKIAAVKHIIKQLRFLNISEIYCECLKQIKSEEYTSIIYFTEIIDKTVRQIEEANLYYEDITPFLYLKGMLEGFEVNTLIKHVFIDEAQDYSPFQFAYIKKMFPVAKLTVLGDIHQSIHAHTNKEDAFLLLETLFQEQEVEKYTLTKSYRSTREIVEFTKGIIAKDINPFNRSGSLPMLVKVQSEEERFSQIVDRLTRTEQKEGTVAIICKSENEAFLVYEYLRSRVQVSLIKKNTTEFDSNIIVIPSYLAKGMEFDRVLIFDASKESYKDEEERKLFYTICTRAMHSLCLFYKKEKTPFLANISVGLYETN